MKSSGVSKYIHFFVTIAIFVIFWKLHLDYVGVQVSARYSFFVFIIYAILYYFFARTYNCYQLGYDSAGELIYSQTITSIIVIFGAYLGISVIWNRFYAVWMFVIAFVVQETWNIIWAFSATKIYFRKNPPRPATVIYRSQADLYRIREIYESRLFKINKEICIDEKTETEDILKAIDGEKVIFVTGVTATVRNGIAKHCVENDVEGYFMPHVGDVIMAGSQHIQSFSVPLQLVQRSDQDIAYKVIKRGFDFVFSLFCIIVLSPIMLIIAIAIKINDGGRVIYKQERLTKNGKRFNIFKFRSMKEDAEADGVARLTVENDDRITKVGRILRSCRFDELPQLFNILSGDMSFVGPRPERPEIAGEISKKLSAFDLRLQVRAGLTGYAQVFGKYNTDPLDKLKLDLTYINHMNALMDLRLIFATVKILLIKDSTEGYQTESL